MAFAHDFDRAVGDHVDPARHEMAQQEIDGFGDSDSAGHTYDLANEGGSGNCFLSNVYTTSFGDITC